MQGRQIRLPMARRHFRYDDRRLPRRSSAEKLKADVSVDAGYGRRALLRLGRVTVAQLTLVSHVLCPYVQRAVIALTEKQVPFERIDVDFANKPQWFTAISPLGKTPVLKVGDSASFESAVILEYLEETQPLPLHPGD